MAANLIKRAGTASPAGTADGFADGSPSPNAWLPPEIGSPRPGADRPWRSTYSGSYAHSTHDVVQQAREKAESLIAEAEAKAKQILDAAHQRADELSLQAHKEGWTAAEDETQYMLQTAKNIVQQIMTWREELFAQSESTVIDLVKEMAVRMFGEGLALDSEILQQNFNHVLENARSMGNITIYMNPEDALALGPYWREYQVSISGREVQVIPSESIRRGGCFVDGKWGSVDARIETQLKSIMDTLSQPPDQML
jgi:flagellar assembly protein FliH